MILIHKATIINEGKSFEGSILIHGEQNRSSDTGDVPEEIFNSSRRD